MAQMFSRAFLLLVAATTVLTVTAPVASAGSGTLDKVRASGTLTLGYREASVPFSYLGADQKPIGFSIDLCLAVAEAVKQQLKLDRLEVATVPVNASNRIPLLQNGTIDIECGSTTNSVERSRQVAFSVATFVSQPTWLVTVASGISDAGSLAGKTTVVTQGSLSLGTIQKANADEKLGLTTVQAKDHGESLLMLQTGRAAGWFEEDILLAGQKATARDPGALRLLTKTYGSAFTDGLMLRKDDAGFKALVDDVIKAQMASGAFATLYNKWFNAPIPPSGQNLALPMSAALKARVSAPSDALAP